jgi:hypothetical protein
MDFSLLKEIERVGLLCFGGLSAVRRRCGGLSEDVVQQSETALSSMVDRSQVSE